MIKVDNLLKLFGKYEVLKNILIQIVEGEVVVVIGFFGFGKLMFLCCLNLLEILSGGMIVIKEKEIIAVKMNKLKVWENIGMVFQYFYLFLYKMVFENIIYVLVSVKKEFKKVVEEKVCVFFEKVGLFEKWNDYLNCLLGGQKQCVVIVCVFVMNFDIMLFDELILVFDLEMVKEVFEVMKEFV